MKKYFTFVKIEHTLFSLPMIYAGMMLGMIMNDRDLFESEHSLLTTILLVLLAATGARTVGFALNRIIDNVLDGKNPRTELRDLPSGCISIAQAYGVMLAATALYFFAAATLNSFCFKLAPFPLAVFFLYPFMKRFTTLAHFGVGTSLALGPLGGFFAIRPTLAGSLPAILLSIFTLLWVSGFDIIYSTLDEAFDRKEGLFSIPSRFGKTRALEISGALHVLAFSILAIFYFVTFFPSWIVAILTAIAGILLYIEQKKADDVELAFFKVNAVVGVVVFMMVLVGFIIQ